ncbi:hypothetical protein [Peribacillus muralis]|uniref:hypothetical protein n=1 Tax=Peribacillus muralis TaxID=264697 RepID=UPI00367251CC
MNRIFFSALIVISLFFVTFNDNNAFASDWTVLDEKIENIEEEQLSEETKQELESKINSGEPLDAEIPSMQEYGETEQYDPYTNVTTYPDGSIAIDAVDYSEAIVTETGEQPSGIVTYGFTGGTWTSGSGFRSVRGLKVSKTVIGAFSVKYKVDLQTIQGGYDKLTRVYEVSPSAYWWKIETQGIFRGTETSEYSAYGGVRFQYRSSENSKLKVGRVYTRVGNDKYWLDVTY